MNGVLAPLPVDAVFPEGLRWHDGALWYSDIPARRIVRVDADGPSLVAELDDDEPSGLGFLPDGTLLVATMWTRRLLRIANGSIALHAAPGGLPPGWFNDMVVDGQGRAYVGHSYPPEKITSRFRPDLGPRPGGGESIVLVHPDGTSEIAAEGLAGPNGMAITADGSTLVVAESPRCRLTSFSIDPDGRLRDRRVLAELGEIRPDGLAVDAADAVWVGGHAHGCLRVTPDGEIAQRVMVPAPRQAIACALGGVERRTLFVSTAILPDSASIRVPGACRGFIDSVDVAVEGAGWP